MKKFEFTLNKTQQKIERILSKGYCDSGVA